MDYLVGGSPWPYSFSPGVFFNSQLMNNPQGILHFYHYYK